MGGHAGAGLRRHLERNNKLAQALGINGTPGFVLGDRVFTGATDLKSLQAAIAEYDYLIRLATTSRGGAGVY